MAATRNRGTARTWKVVVGCLFFVCLVVVNNENISFLSPKQQQQQPNPTVLPSTITTKEIPNDMHSNWWDPFVDSLAVVYSSPFSNNVKTDPFPWCKHTNDNNNNNNTISGLVYVKIPKTASSTCAGITLRLAHNVALRKKLSKQPCPHTAVHGFAYAQRQAPYLLWTSLRHPSHRVISEFFFKQVSQQEILPTGINMLRFIPSKVSFQLDYISRITTMMGRPPPPRTRYPLKYATIEQVIELMQKDVFGQYHFILITERMDESLAVLQLLFGFQDTDLIVFASKHSASSSGGDDGGGYDGLWGSACHKIAPKVVPPEVQAYLATNFTHENYDFLLYAAANRSLDLTIRALGRDRVDRTIQRHRYLQALAEDSCRERAIFPCSPNGTYQSSLANCYERDFGCGYPCMDELFANEGGHY